MRQTNQAGIDLIKRWEGFRAKAYRCPAGVLTIGYGHTSRAGRPLVFEGMVISESEGEEILKRDLEKYEDGVVDALGPSVNKLSDNQFAACVSLCYNIGPGAFARSSVARYIQSGQINAAASRFAAWNKAGGRVLKGLVNRRAEETTLYRS